MEELSPRLFFVQTAPTGRLPGFCHGLAASPYRSTFERVVPGFRGHAGVCGDSPPGARKDNSYYFSLLFSVAKVLSASKFKQPGIRSFTRGSMQQILLQGSPKRSRRVQADSRYANVPGLPAALLRESCRFLERQAARRQR